MKRLLMRGLLVLMVLLVAGMIGGYFWAQQRSQAAPNRLVHTAPELLMPFRWLPIKVGDTSSPHGARAVPVHLPGCGRTFHMQFDLGATSSLLYDGKLSAIAEKCTAIATADHEGERYAANVTLRLHETDIVARKIRVRNVGGGGIDWDNPAKVELIGTLGSDIIDGKVVAIDYPHTLISVGDALPMDMAAPQAWSDFSFDNRRTILQATIDGKPTPLYFDTGSSAFELLTNPETWAALAAPGAQGETFTVNSWGRPLTAHRIKSDKRVEIGGVSLPLAHVTMIEGASVMQHLLGRVIGIGGMTGNTLFLDKTLVLDTRNRKVGFAAP